jgi:arabinofuranan 3-O-arabinosyltransferase
VEVPGPVPAQPSPRVVWRVRHAAVCVALTALAFLQAPGLTVLDTKVDLTVDPVSWLDRALHLWDPSGGFGQLQNQAYGYLWPMGPFFVAGSWLGVPEWVIQRLWWALVMVVAYAGVIKLSGKLGIGTPFARTVAAVAFAVSPRVLTELGTISAEAWPTAVAPWVLVPLVGLAHGQSIRRSVALSAVAVGCAGGINATAVFAVVPMAVLWLALLNPLRRRLVALAGWVAAVAAATAWWVVPLLLLGRYSPPFLDYIETARSTTRITDLVTVARGTSHWLAYLGGPYGPLLPAGFRLATETTLIAATLAVAAIGVIGLARPGLPHRRFLVLSLLVGLALVGMGHVTAIDGGVAAVVRDFLDGAGAPLRNVHKFDVIVRLPLVLGLAHLLGLAARTAATAGRGPSAARLRSAALTATAVVAVVGVATPAVAGSIPTHGSYDKVPGYWHEATAWLDAHAGRDHVLVVPGARFPTYLWGRPSDEITQPLMSRSWAVRSGIPLTPPSTIRLLDSIESALATGTGSRGLADVLARSGVRYVLVRSDLDYGRSASVRPMVVRQALARSPGLERVAAFGPIRGGDELLDHTYTDRGLDVPVRSLEVFEVNRPVAHVVAYDASAVTTVTGGPEALLDLAATGELPSAPAVLAGDRPAGRSVGRLAITDTLRRREVAFGLGQDSTSGTLGATEEYRIDGPAHDYLPPWGPEHLTVARYRGVESVTASNSWAQLEPLVGSRPEHLPYAAMDGDPDTSWRTPPSAPVTGQWLEVGLTAATVVPEVRLRFDPEADFLPTAVTVRAGLAEATVEVTELAVTVALPGRHAAQRVRIIIDEVAQIRAGTGGVGISEVAIPGVVARRTLALPAPPPTAEPATVVLTAAPAVASCFFLADRTRCAPAARRASEDGTRLDRTVTLPAGGEYQPSVWARPRPGPALSALLDREVAGAAPLGLLPNVTASSTQVPDPAGRAGVVLDGDPSTAWSPASGDRNPWLRATWLAPRTIVGLRFGLAEGVAATPIGTVTVVGDDGLRTGPVDEDGSILFDRPMRTDEISVVFPEQPPLQSFDPYGNRAELLPVAVGELTVLPDPPNRRPDLDVPVNLDCGSGPTLIVDGVYVPTALRATRRQLQELREVPARPCAAPGVAPVTLGAGTVQVVAAASRLALPTRVRLAPEREGPGRTGPGTPTPVRVDGWSAAQRRVHLPASVAERVLAVRENVNPGWRATLDGRDLAPIVVDGWQQGWIVPAGAGGEVVLAFTPDRPYRVAMIVGAVAFLVLLVVAAARPRRPGAHAYIPSPRDSRGRRRDWPLPAAIGGLAILLVGGVAGLVLIVLAGLVVFAWRLAPLASAAPDHRRRRRLVLLGRWWGPVALFGLAAWLWVAAGDDRGAAGPQLAALAMAVALWLSVVLPGLFHRRAAQR